MYVRFVSLHPHSALEQHSVSSCLDEWIPQLEVLTEGWLEIDKHYLVELCFSIEKTALDCPARRTYI